METIGYKTDVGARAEDFVSEKKNRVTEKVAGAKETVTSSVSRVVPSRDGIKQKSQSLTDTAQRNPIGVAIGAAAVGFLAGMLIPSTRVENEKVGEIADRVRDQASEIGHEALERGKDVAQEAKDAAVQTVRERGREETKELASNLRGDGSQESNQRAGSGHNRGDV
jgi:gas vesicle protein